MFKYDIPCHTRELCNLKTQSSFLPLIAIIFSSIYYNWLFFDLSQSSFLRLIAIVFSSTYCDRLFFDLSQSSFLLLIAIVFSSTYHNRLFFDSSQLSVLQLIVIVSSFTYHNRLFFDSWLIWSDKMVNVRTLKYYEQEGARTLKKRNRFRIRMPH